MPRNYQFSDAERERSRNLEAARRARIAELPKEWKKHDKEECLQAFDYKCGYCGTPEHDRKLEFDHFIDLHSADCPGTLMGNMVPACPKCNRRKGLNGAELICSPEQLAHIRNILKGLGASWLP